MLTFLRKIRKSLIESGSVRKYLIYAIGEIALVVIGILIALQINNRNEERKRLLSEKEMIYNLIQSLERDSILNSFDHSSLVGTNLHYNKLFEIIVHGKEDVSFENPAIIRRGVAYEPVTPNHFTNVGSKISNDAARDAVLRYFHIEKRVKAARDEYWEVIKDRMRVFLSQREVHDLANWYSRKDENSAPIINEEDLIALT